MIDPIAFGKAMGSMVRDAVAVASKALGARIDALEGRVATIPAGEKGERGERGDAGEAGPRGEQGERGADGSAGERGPQGEQGQQGERGAPGEAGRDGRDGQPGRDGEKGADGTHGRDGVDGEKGIDGLGFDDLEVVHDGARGFVFRFARADVVREFAFSLPVVLDAGVFKEGASYVQGDGVTFGGSWWIAQKDSPAGKPGLSDDWRLAVKKGRDGKDGRNGIDKTASLKAAA